jgi:threonyl-tRNA synthetase
MRNEKIGYKIREAQMQKIPYMLVIGDKEVENGSVAVRTRTSEQMNMSLEDFLKKITEERDTKAL